MLKKLSIIAIVLALSIAFNSNIIQAQDHIAQESIKVRVTVPAFQELEVVEPVEVSFTYPEEQLAADEPLILRGLGQIRVASNSSWMLQVENQVSTDFQIYVRPSGHSSASWQLITGRTASISGNHGRHSYSFDVMVQPAAGNLEDLTGTIALSYTLMDI